MYVELVLYNGLVTGTLDVSVAGAGGPWTSFSLPSPMAFIDAIAWWRAAADAALTGTYSWFVSPDASPHPQVSFDGAGHHVRMTACLANLLGFGGLVVAAGALSTQPPRGLLRAPGVARTQPVDKAKTSLVEYRGGRASSYTYGRAKEVTLELYLDAATAEAQTQTPLGSGHGALRVTVEDETDAYSSDVPAGRLTVYPYHSPEVSGDESGGDWTRVVILATAADFV